MSKTEILEQLSKLTAEERYEIRLKLAELDGEWFDDDDLLTDQEKTLTEARLAAHESDPEAAIPWEEARALINRRLGE